MNLYWIIESIYSQVIWRNSSVTHNTAQETQRNMQELKGKGNFKILFASLLLSAGMYLPTYKHHVPEEVQAQVKGSQQQWYQTIPRSVVSLPINLQNLDQERIFFFFI